MSEYMWGLTREKPSRSKARQLDRICREAGGYGFTEIHLTGRLGTYQGWFSGPNRGYPFDLWLEQRVEAAIAKAKGGSL